MKKIIPFFTLVTLIGLVSCDTFTRYTLRVQLDRSPMLVIENQTGYSVALTAPATQSLNHGARAAFQPADANQSIDVVYRIEAISFTEQVNMGGQDATVTLTRRPPTITVVNNTGYQVALAAPARTSIPNAGSDHFLAPRLNQNIDIVYQVGQMTFTEQLAMRDQDVTVTLTRRPPTITVINNVGATINTIFLRTPGAPSWTGGNIVIRNGIVNVAAAGAGAQAGEISGSIVNRDSMQIWMGNIPLSGDRFDIRIDDVQGTTYVRSNVQIRDDITITFTTSDRR